MALGREFIIAAALVALFTLIRRSLTSTIESSSAFLIYVAPVALAATLFGARCGGLVMLGGGLTALYLFVAPRGAWSFQSSALVQLILFWLVCAAVLLPASALRHVLIHDRVPRLRRLRRARNPRRTQGPNSGQNRG